MATSRNTSGAASNAARDGRLAEYMTHDGDSTLANTRRRNGRDEPWKTPFLGVGNENWECGGNMTADHYADLYHRFAVYARNYGGNELTRIAGGPSGGDLNWIETLMRRICSNMEAEFDEKGWITILKNALRTVLETERSAPTCSASNA